MRWSDTCTLVAKSYEPDSEGVPQPREVRTEVFCNEYSIGANTWSSMYEIGISADAEIQVWTCEYSGQRDVLYKGTWYSVERVKVEQQHGGDFTRLTLRHQKSDDDEKDGEEEHDDGS
jgi:hypothetical protein